VLSRVGVVSLDRFVFLVFLVDHMGGFGAFDWGWVDMVLSSDSLLESLESLMREGYVKVMGGVVSGLGGGADCGWLLGRVSATVDYVLGRFGSLSDDELRVLVESVFRGDV
jgi:hypothetical protein